MAYKSKHFADSEFLCRCGCGQGREKMDDGFVLKLDKLRKEFGKPINLSSAYRCPAHNSRVSSTGSNGPHTTGRAVDIRTKGQDAWRLLQIASELGFKGLGVAQKGAHGSRFLHVDDIAEGPRPWVWSY